MLDIGHLFNESYYLSSNPDVASAVKNGYFQTGLDHFNKFGQFENRDPSVLFDTNFYLKSNTDVATAVKQGKITAVQHYIQYGEVENRDPLTQFNANFYLKNNTDVNNAVSASKSAKDPLTAYEHFIKFGQFEERDASTRFSSQRYLQKYTDVASAVKSNNQLSAFNHFVQFGKNEGRLSIGSANSIAFRVVKQDANNLDPSFTNVYSFSNPPASDTTGTGPIYGYLNSLSLPGTVAYNGPISPVATPLSPNYSNYAKGNNVYNDSPYYESKISWTIRTEDPKDSTLTFDVANSKSDLFSSITQTSPTNLTFSGGGIPPYSWFKLERIWTGLGSETSAYHDDVSFSVNPS